MQAQAEMECKDHPDLSDCPDSLIYVSNKNNYFGMRVHDGGSSSIEILYCPWCGVQLKQSNRIGHKNVI